MTYTDLQEALRVLGLGEQATLRQIKARHRELVKLHHPDTGQATEPEAIRRVNEAYQIMLAYLDEYCFSFTEEQFYEQNTEERVRRQFMEDPLWSMK